ncbi:MULTISPECIES: hypothetical protein [Novacetimonas]|uniref:hypothetical protein n=1 Tax=Novacetimonas TaxID=2919364 RepID=UPI0002EB2852|nr:hypothetical protein [Novacetimonas hansenii]
MPLKSRHRPQGTPTSSSRARLRPTVPDRLRPARGMVIGIMIGLACWGAIIAAFCLLR